MLQVEPDRRVNQKGIRNGIVPHELDVYVDIKGADGIRNPPQNVVLAAPEALHAHRNRQFLDGIVLGEGRGGDDHLIDEDAPPDPLDLQLEQRASEDLLQHLAREPRGAHPRLNGRADLHVAASVRPP